MIDCSKETIARNSILEELIKEQDSPAEHLKFHMKEYNRRVDRRQQRSNRNKFDRRLQHRLTQVR